MKLQESLHEVLSGAGEAGDLVMIAGELQTFKDAARHVASESIEFKTLTSLMLKTLLEMEKCGYFRTTADLNYYFQEVQKRLSDAGLQ